MKNEDRLIDMISKSSDSVKATEIAIEVIRSFLEQIQSETAAHPDDLPERSQVIAV